MSKYVEQAVKNVLAGMLQLVDSDGNALVSATSPALVYPTTYPFMCGYPGGVSPAGQQDSIGDTYRVDRWGVVLRYIAGKIGDSYLGGQEVKLWEWSVLMLETLRRYPSLEFLTDGTTPEIPQLDPRGATVTGVTRFGVFRDDSDHLGFEITLDIPFIIENERIWR